MFYRGNLSEGDFMKLDDFIPNSSKASSQLKVFLAIMIVGLASLIFVSAASALPAQYVNITNPVNNSVITSINETVFTAATNTTANNVTFYWINASNSSALVEICTAYNSAGNLFSCNNTLFNVPDSEGNTFIAVVDNDTSINDTAVNVSIDAMPPIVNPPIPTPDNLVCPYATNGNQNLNVTVIVNPTGNNISEVYVDFNGSSIPNVTLRYNMSPIDPTNTTWSVIIPFNTTNYNSTGGIFQTYPLFVVVKDNNGWEGINFSDVVIYKGLGLTYDDENIKLSTNLCNITNFTDANLSVTAELNGTGGTFVSENGTQFEFHLWDGFKEVMFIQFYGLNLFDDATMGALFNLFNAINFRVPVPHAFGNASLFVNTSMFASLNGSAEIEFYNTPFSDSNFLNMSGINTSDIPNINTTLGTPYNITINNVSCTVPNMTIKFNVSHFSGYTIADTVDPIVTISPVISPTKTPFNVSAKINGTGTAISKILVKLNDTILYSLNDTALYTYCTDLTSDGTVINCTFPINEDYNGNYTLNITARDFGGTTGNVGSATQYPLLIDTTPPLIQNLGIGIANDSATFDFNTNENAKCFIDYGLTDSFGTPTALDGWNTTHHFVINNLNNGTQYHYNINCTDVLGNSGNIIQSTFRTTVEYNGSLNASTTTTIVANSTENGTTNKFVELELTPNSNLSIDLQLFKLDSKPYPSAKVGDVEVGLYFFVGSNVANFGYAIIKVYYNPADLPSNIDVSTMRLYYYNNTIQKWVKIPGGVNTTAHYVWGNTTHFSTWAVGGEQTTSNNDNTNTGSSGSTGGLPPQPTNNVWTGGTFEAPMVVGDNVILTWMSENHTITLMELTQDSAKVQVASTPTNITLAVGETKNVDINGDGINDISIYLSKIELGKAYFTLDKLTQGTTTEPTAPTENGTTTPTTPINENGGSSLPPTSSEMSPLIVGIIVLAIIGGAILFLKPELLGIKKK